MTKFNHLFVCSALLYGSSVAFALNVDHLRVEYRNNPVGIDCGQPHFSWQLSSDKRSTMQTTYQIVLATDAAMSAVVYDSGSIESGESANVKLPNLTLQPSTRYYWKVTVTDNHGGTATSSPGSYFETGLMDSGWSGAKWISPSNGQIVNVNDKDIKNYVIETDFEIQRAAAGLIWGAKDRNNFYMWQFNVQGDVPMFRPHIWRNGNPECIAEIPISQPLERFKTYHAKIEITDDGAKVLTYLDGTLIDERTGSFPYGSIGMRASNINGNMHQPECAWYDDFKVTSAAGEVLYLDSFDTNENYGTGVVEDGRLYVSGPETLVFQNNFTPDSNVKNYTFEGKFTIEQYCAGIVFAATDNDNFTMWQFNIENGYPRFRPHVWNNGNPACLAEIDLSNVVSMDAYTPHTFKIVVSDDGRRCTTYIDNIEIDSREGNFGYGKVGFRHSRSEREWTIYERALFDNLTVTSENGDVLISEDFEDPADVIIAGGKADNGKLLLDGYSEIYAWSPFSSSDSKLRYDIDVDMTLIKDAASIIFSRTKSNCYFMWAINTNDKGYPLLRRHVYANSSDPQFSDTRLEGMTNSDFLGKARHIKIEIDDRTVRTYIDENLVDTFTDNTGLLTKGLMGFRVYHDAVNEQAYWDNVVMTVYGSDGSRRVAISEDFENEAYEFSSGDIVNIDGNNKLYSFSPLYESIVLQDAGTSSPRFRKGFNLAGKVRSARLYSSALGVYNLYVNGERVGELQNDGSTVYDELMPGWTDYRSSIFYFTHDVTDLLKEGDNAIGAEVSSGWWLGQVSHGIYGSSELAFIGKLVVELESGEIVTIVTDPSWVYSADGAIKSGEIYHGENFDARRVENWTAPDY
ncbi:MAG: alpha-L-rhamnosidase N-terminal domain-containing protein, partial [Muribaculaceae bacterium]|nr:alpha-L-rhamnosidase N-terminal domain-containing protein [Muribaculaceae bacterium]